jgi:hypothetical protein
MIRSRRLSLLTAFAALCLTLTACADIEGLVLSDLGADTDLSASTDPEVQAAAAANEAIRNEQEAQLRLRSALESNQLDSALEAVELRPLDPTYRVYFSALLWANGDNSNATDELRYASGLLQAQGVGTKGRLGFAMDIFLKARASFAPGTPQYDRLTTEYCTGLKEYTELALEEDTDVLTSILDVASYPDDDCR